MRAVGLTAVPALVAMVLLPARGHVDPAQIALVLMVAVVLVAAGSGRRVVALVAAVGAAVAFNVLHTEPYGSLRISGADDVTTFVVLLCVALAVAELSQRARRALDWAGQLRRDVDHLHAVGSMVADGTPPILVVARIHQALRDVLPVRDVRFEVGTRWSDDRGEALVARWNGIVVGRYLVDPDPGRTVAPEQRLTALALTDQAGAAIVVGASPDPVDPSISLSLPEGGDGRPRPPIGTTRGLVAAVLLPLATAVALLPTRNWFDNTNVALVLVAAVVAVATRGQRRAALVAAATAALCFDVLHTRPYYSPAIRAREDLLTAVVLLVVGVAVAELVVRARVAGVEATRRGGHLARIQTLSELIAHGEEPDFVVIAAAQGLRDLLDLDDARFERAPRWGAVRRADIILPVAGGGTVLGRFVLTLRPEAAPTADAWVAAAVLVQQVGAALATVR
jgi:K+-sensing histidine kinase KdpD